MLGQATTAAATHELTEEQQAMLKERLSKVDEQDRAAEEMAIRAEIRARQDAAARLQGIYKEQELERQRRRETGEETTWDKVVGTFKGGSKDK